MLGRCIPEMEVAHQSRKSWPTSDSRFLEYGSILTTLRSFNAIQVELLNYL